MKNKIASAKRNCVSKNASNNKRNGCEKARSVVKLRIKKIDPTFTGRNIDPQDVKAVFHPVEYIVFQGLCSGLGVKELKFISRSPKTKAQEALVRSMDQTVQKGNLEFETLHLQEDGSFIVRKA